MIENSRPCESEAFGLEFYSQLTGKDYLPPDEIHNHVTKDDDRIIFKDIVFDDEILFEQLLNNPCNYRKHMEIINCVFARDVLSTNRLNLWLLIVAALKASFISTSNTICRKGR